MPLGMVVGLSPGDFVFDGDPATRREKGTPFPTQFLAHVYCGQTAGWIKMPLGTEVNLGPGDIVLDGVAAPPKRGTVPQFRFMSIVAKRLDGCRHHWYGSKPSPRPRPHYIRRGPSSSRKGHSSPLSPSFRPMSIVATVANLSYCRALVHDFYRCAALNYTSRALHPTEKKIK